MNRCLCGGELYADEFAWPKIKSGEKWYLRCTCCSSMSEFFATRDQALQAERLNPITWDWASKRVAILASGPSMSSEVAQQARLENDRVIVINTTFLLAPWADVLYAADASWWKNAKGAMLFRGNRASIESAISVRPFKNAGRIGYSDDQHVLHTYGNSGAQAIQIAAKAGSKKISLYGFDFHGSHWHGRHPEPPMRNTSTESYDKWNQEMYTLSSALLERGVDVMNRTPGSKLTCFRMHL